MSAQRWKLYLLALSASTIAAAILFFTIAGMRDQPLPPEDLDGRLQWLASHPADWHVAAQISDQALESSMPRRFELWRKSHELSTQLAPWRAKATAEFVRAGLFHWYELEDADRAAVLRDVEPLLEDQAQFAALLLPLWQLTGNVKLLQKAAGGDVIRLTQVAGLAVTNGYFAEYRQMDDALRAAQLRDLRATKATTPPAEMLRFIYPPLDMRDLPLVNELLQALHERPIDRNPAHAEAAAALLTFALRHDLQPLDGLEYLVREPPSATDPLRARLALRLGDRARAMQIRLASNVGDPKQWAELERELMGLPPLLAPSEEWDGLCGETLCASAARQLRLAVPRHVTLAIDKVESDEVPPYVEVLLDDRVVAQGEVPDSRRFSFDAAAGNHRLEVRLVNALTRNLTHRRVRLSSLS